MCQWRLMTGSHSQMQSEKSPQVIRFQVMVVSQQYVLAAAFPKCVWAASHKHLWKSLWRSVWCCTGSDLHSDNAFGNFSKDTEIHFGVTGDFLLIGFALGAQTAASWMQVQHCAGVCCLSVKAGGTLLCVSETREACWMCPGPVQCPLLSPEQWVRSVNCLFESSEVCFHKFGSNPADAS